MAAGRLLVKAKATAQANAKPKLKAKFKAETSAKAKARAKARARAQNDLAIAKRRDKLAQVEEPTDDPVQNVSSWGLGKGRPEFRITSTGLLGA